MIFDTNGNSIKVGDYCIQPKQHRNKLSKIVSISHRQTSGTGSYDPDIYEVRVEHIMFLDNDGLPLLWVDSYYNKKETYMVSYYSRSNVECDVEFEKIDEEKGEQFIKELKQTEIKEKLRNM